MTELFNHQKEAVEFALARRGNCAIFHEMGLGKTRTALEIFNRLREGRPDLKLLVVAPLSLLEAAWGEDIQKFGFNFPYMNLNKNDVPKVATGLVFLINYERLLSRAEQVKEFLRKSGSPWFVVLDESSKIKNHASQVSKLLLKMAPMFEHRMIMTGTPAPNSEAEYWPQMSFVVHGCLGTSVTVFRNHFFHLVNRRSGEVQSIPGFTSRAAAAEVYKRCDVSISSEKREELMGLIKPLCHMAKKKDCLDLPEQIDETRLVQMGADQTRAYRELERHLVTEIQDQTIAAPVALTKLMKLRQITSGFVYNEFGESFEVSHEGFCDRPGDPSGPAKIPIARDFSNPKIAELFDIIEEAGDQQMIIWINFHWEQIRVCHELDQKFGTNQVVTLSSLTVDRDGSIKAFREGRARFLVAHPASAAHGLTFVNCALDVFFSLNFSLEQYDQARARMHRAGQIKNVTHVHLLAQGTIDEQILAVLRAKGTAQQLVSEFLNNKRR